MAAVPNPEWLALLDDDQLRVEWARRHPNHGVIIGRELTDDQLRAECERRGIGKTQAAQDVRCAANCSALSEELGEVKRERDEWKRRAEANEADLLKLGWAPPLKSAQWEAMVAENVALTRRAEAAEEHNERRGDWLAEITELCERHGMAKGIAADAALSWFGERLQALHVMSLRGHEDRSSTRGESGPGIAATPEPSDAHYVDPWDLLADDA